MKTLIRIKRRLDEEPVENIVVKPKRLRICQIEGAAAADPNIPAYVLKRVATVESKEEQLELEILKTAEKRYLKGCELQTLYKKPRKSEEFKDFIKHEARERTSCKRHMVHASYRGNIVDIDLGKERGAKANKDEDKETNSDGDKKKDSQKSENGKVDDSPLVAAADEIKYLDAEVNRKVDDVITCNGIPMQSEKYVYDIYYSPASANWADYVCDVQEYLYDSCINFGDDDDDDDDDENAEDNWRNDYPDEDDDSSFEDEEECRKRESRRSSFGYYDSDEEPEELDFDDEGCLIHQDFDNQVPTLRKFFTRVTIQSDSEDN